MFGVKRTVPCQYAGRCHGAVVATTVAATKAAAAVMVAVR
jgi:hypothetical protein